MERKPRPVTTFDPAVYDAHRTLINKVIAAVARQQHLTRDVAEEFASMAWERLLEGDVMARFEGRSSLRTFLTVVIGNLYRDFRNQRWGKWRHSAEARRLGPVALRLELLMVRDGHTFDEAVAILQTNFAVAATRDELYAMSLQLPHRSARRFVGDDELERVGIPADSIEHDAERGARRQRLHRVRLALKEALSGLPSQDRLILRFLFEDGFTIAQVAAMLHIPQKPLYRRRDAIFAEARRRLESAGVHADDVHALWQELHLQ